MSQPAAASSPSTSSSQLRNAVLDFSRNLHQLEQEAHHIISGLSKASPQNLERFKHAQTTCSSTLDMLSVLVTSAGGDALLKGTLAVQRAHLETLTSRVSESLEQACQNASLIQEIQQAYTRLVRAPLPSAEALENLRGRLTSVLASPGITLGQSARILHMHTEMEKLKERIVRQAWQDLYAFVAQLFIENTAIDEPIKQEFERLLARISPDLSGKIYEAVWRKAGEPNIPDYGKNNVFADRENLLHLLLSLPEYPKPQVKETLHSLKELVIALPSSIDDRSRRQFFSRFYLLPAPLQTKIYKKIWESAHKPQGDPDFGKNHILTTPATLVSLLDALLSAREALAALRALAEATPDRILSLLEEKIPNQELRNRIYGEIWKRAGEPATTDLEWGKNHVAERFNDLLAILRDL